MSDSIVLTDIDPRGVATITLNRPDVNNAYNGVMIDGLLTVFAQLKADTNVRLVVLRGNGRHFQAGADLRWLQEVAAQSPEENVEVSRRTANAVRGLNEFPCPTIALIQGGCFGGGTGIAAACDIVIASEDALFAISEARWGVMAGIVFPQLLAAMGLRNLRRYALSCERFNAQQAQSLGLVHEVCAVGELDATAEPIIEHLLLAAPDATAQSKHRCLQLAGQVLDDSLLEQLIQEHSEKRQTAEASEGLRSFVEKRKPSWYPN